MNQLVCEHRERPRSNHSTETHDPFDRSIQTSDAFQEIRVVEGIVHDAVVEIWHLRHIEGVRLLVVEALDHGIPAPLHQHHSLPDRCVHKNITSSSKKEKKKIFFSRFDSLVAEAMCIWIHIGILD